MQRDYVGRKLSIGIFEKDLFWISDWRPGGLG
jgi:hypothetical protein